MRPWNLLCKWTITALSVSVTSLCLASIEVNNADEAELDSVKGLGPASTARILKAREQGPFKDWADFLQRVKGFKAKAAERLSEAGLTVHGAPFAPAKDQKTQP